MSSIIRKKHQIHPNGLMHPVTKRRKKTSLSISEMAYNSLRYANHQFIPNFDMGSVKFDMFIYQNFVLNTYCCHYIYYTFCSVSHFIWCYPLLCWKLSNTLKILLFTFIDLVFGNIKLIHKYSIITLWFSASRSLCNSILATRW